MGDRQMHWSAAVGEFVWVLRVGYPQGWREMALWYGWKLGRRVRWRWEELSRGLVSAFVRGGAGEADMEEADWVDERTGAEKEC